MRVRYTPRALADLRHIADYIRERNPSASINVATAIRLSVGLLADFPRIGRDRPEISVRSLSVPRHPYTIYYRIELDDVWIVHIRDDRRRPLEKDDL